LVVHPETVYLPEFLRGKGKTWGIFLPLYALKSGRNWGVGDLQDLRELMVWMGKELQAGFVGINPLHAIKNRRPYNLSPYFPSIRNYRNFIYLDVEGVPEFRECPEAQKMVKGKDFQRELAALRSSPLVDYERVASLKGPGFFPVSGERGEGLRGVCHLPGPERALPGSGLAQLAERV
jgi:4-alpha-glucanotransferase